ncbi:hypothetical protein BAE44_0009775 [Dichanthelium oligosanthes]|uniref:PHD-type zinc finger plants domain-containing protein n=1 Tax=Dichanthelium oligosanthes TaxID=888268 RepID=A0A1E5VVT2_9POAL|nr:hypothetical protein BAE44_0009775 [Dichanthelium oligosanthes]
MAAPGSDDGASSAAAAAVCCMCGDHGLPQELFWCNLCRLRLQHRYCSDLYPRVPGPYRSCNWCLSRENGGGGGSSPVKAPVAAGAKRRLNDPRDEDNDRDQQERPCGGVCTRSAFSADPGKPVKKPKPKKGRDCERAVQRPVVVATAPAKKRRELQQAGAGGNRFSRVKVRWYKLLAEVIC